MKARVGGFNYQTGTPVEHTRKEWMRQLRAAMADGGFRRTERGETFIHGKDGRIIAEVYANVPAQPQRQERQ